jgi:hypothetical protein
MAVGADTLPAQALSSADSAAMESRRTMVIEWFP